MKKNYRLKALLICCTGKPKKIKQIIKIIKNPQAYFVAQAAFD